MTLFQGLFYVFSAMALASATLVVTTRNPVRAVLFLVLTFFTMGGVWILLEAEFLAITLILVYIGAVMVLFLFVVMMLNIEEATLRSGFTRYLPLGICVSVLVVVGLVYAVAEGQFGLKALPKPPSLPANVSQVKQLGELLFTQYLYSFEVAGVLLLVAIVSAISLSFRGNRARKTPHPREQIQTRKADRIQLIDLERSSLHGNDDPKRQQP